MTSGDYMAVCGDILYEEYEKDPKRFERIYNDDAQFSDWIYIAAIYIYNPLKIEMVGVSLMLIYLYCAMFVFPWANVYWMALLSFVFAMITTMFMYTPFVAIFFGLPLFIAALIASVIGSWVGW